MTIQEVIQGLQADGWHLIREEDHVRHFRHEGKSGIVTLAGQPELRLPPGVFRTLKRYAKFEGES